MAELSGQFLTVSLLLCFDFLLSNHQQDLCNHNSCAPCHMQTLSFQTLFCFSKKQLLLEYTKSILWIVSVVFHKQKFCRHINLACHTKVQAKLFCQLHLVQTQKHFHCLFVNLYPKIAWGLLCIRKTFCLISIFP